MRIKGWLVLVQGDFNRTLQFNTNLTQLETWMAINQLTSPEFEHLQPLLGYHTFNSGGDKQSETLIDHSMYTPLPADVLLEELDAVNLKKGRISPITCQCGFVLPSPVR